MSLMSLSRGAWEKSGPLGVIGTKAIASAISRPPQAMKGIANETPVSRCCRRFLSILGIGVQCYKSNVVHCSRKPAHRALAKVAPYVYFPPWFLPETTAPSVSLQLAGDRQTRFAWRFARRLHFSYLWNCTRHGSVVCVISPNPETGEME